jgi:uncharacterized protein
MLNWPLFGEFLLQWLTLAFMLIGLVGLIVPIFPGLVVIWLAALIYGIAAGGFDTKGWIIFIVISILALIGGIVDNIFMGAKARESGAAWISIWVSNAAGVIFSLIFTPLIGLIAAPAGLFISELIHRKDWRPALKTVRAMLIGWGWSFVVRLIIGIAMIGLWMIWAWA